MVEVVTTATAKTWVERICSESRARLKEIEAGMAVLASEKKQVEDVLSRLGGFPKRVVQKVLAPETRGVVKANYFEKTLPMEAVFDGRFDEPFTWDTKAAHGKTVYTYKLDPTVIRGILKRVYPFTVKDLISRVGSPRMAYGYISFLMFHGKVEQVEHGLYRVVGAKRKVRELKPRRIKVKIVKKEESACADTAPVKTPPATTSAMAPLTDLMG